MIIFDLACDCGYCFEGWFQGHDDFHEQQNKGLLNCPECGNGNVKKILSPVAVHSSSQQSDIKNNYPIAQANDLEQIASHSLKVLQSYVEKNFDDVGPKLAEEALKMHYGVQDSRRIRGIATHEEEKILEKEGIELLKIPILTKNNKVN